MAQIVHMFARQIARHANTLTEYAAVELVGRETVVK